MVLEKANQNSVLLVPEGLNNILYIKNSLEILGVKYKIVEDDKDIIVKHLLLPSMVWWGNRYNPEYIRLLSNRFLKGLPQNNILSDRHSKIFIIREKGRRKIKNADEVKVAMLNLGFYVVDFEGKTQQEQIALVSSAKILVAQHGAGLTNILFMPLGGKVVEIYVDPAENNYHFDDSYYILSSALGHDYYCFISQKANAEANFFESDHYINVEELVKTIESV
jgi:capsular polysaccharide biosynthesis protein